MPLRPRAPQLRPLATSRTATNRAAAWVDACRPWVLALALALLQLGAWAEPAKHQAPMRVATDDNYPPYIFRNADGQPEGYLVD